MLFFLNDYWLIRLRFTRLIGGSLGVLHYTKNQEMTTWAGEDEHLREEEETN